MATARLGANAESNSECWGSFILRINTSLAAQSLLSRLCKAFPSDGHGFKLCAMIWRYLTAGEVTALSGTLQIFGQFQHFELQATVRCPRLRLMPGQANASIHRH